MAKKKPVCRIVYQYYSLRQAANDLGWDEGYLLHLGATGRAKIWCVIRDAKCYRKPNILGRPVVMGDPDMAPPTEQQWLYIEAGYFCLLYPRTLLELEVGITPVEMSMVREIAEEPDKKDGSLRELDLPWVENAINYALGLFDSVQSEVNGIEKAVGAPTVSKDNLWLSAVEVERLRTSTNEVVETNDDLQAELEPPRTRGRVYPVVWALAEVVAGPKGKKWKSLPDLNKVVLDELAKAGFDVSALTGKDGLMAYFTKAPKRDEIEKPGD